MCLIIDINVLGAVFDSKNSKHNHFEPVKTWILDGRGKVVYGGSRYIKELAKTPRYLRLLLQLRKAEKACYVENDKVDEAEKKICHEIRDEDFDDQHIVALLVVSKCKLICSLDERAYQYFTHPELFKPASNRPRIYKQRANKSLLCQENIADICLPCEPTTNLQRKQINV
jgi:hypothetical protein